MMHFLQPAADTPLYIELKEAGLLPPNVIERADRELRHPESGTLDQFLFAAADSVSEPEWLSWLIRRHGCHRFGAVAWREDAAEDGSVPDLSDEPNRPYGRDGAGHPLIAVMRPDRWSHTAAPYADRQPRRAAATLSEARALKSAWARWQVGAGTSR